MAGVAVGKSGESSERPDGRSLRRQQNIELAIDAFAALAAKQFDLPTLEQVAVRAGLSVSSVYRYFGHVDDLFAAAAERLRAQVGAVFAEKIGTKVADVPLEQRVEQYLADRRQLRTVSRGFSSKSVELFSDHRLSAEVVGEIRALIRKRISEVFASELAESETAQIRDLRIAAIQVAGSMATRQYLLNEWGYTDDQIDAYLSWQITAALGSTIEL